MHIRCKFDGEKQVNRSQSRSWEGRCAGTALKAKKEQHGDHHTGKRSLILNLANPLNLFLLLNAKMLQL